MTRNEIDLQRRAADLVHREVGHCVSGLVATLAEGAYHFTQRRGAMPQLDRVSDLAEQAADLAAPIPDYESAAREAGWNYHVANMTGQPSFQHVEHGTFIAFDGWCEVCGEYGIEPHDREVFEHWIVSDWLADKLEAKGEKVDRDFAGLTIWARTTTGQAIAADWVIEAIAADLEAAR